MHSGTVLRLFLKQKVVMRVFRRFHEANIVCSSMQTGETLLCYASPIRSQNNRNIVGTCCAKSLTGFKLYAASANIRNINVYLLKEKKSEGLVLSQLIAKS